MEKNQLKESRFFNSVTTTITLTEIAGNLVKKITQNNILKLHFQKKHK